MKKLFGFSFKAVFEFILISSFLFTTSVHADTMTVNPQFLRERLLQDNISILAGINQIYQAKLNVSIARGNLLPSLNLGAALQSAQSNFILASITVLMPFLIPSNWFNYRQNEYLFDAEKQSYFLLQLNTYASAYSTLQIINEDAALREILNTQYQNLVKIQDVIAKRVELGLSSQTDLIQAQSQVQMAMVQLSQMDELLDQENATFREALALPLEQDFSIERAYVPLSDAEAMTSKDLLEASLKISPEYAQINSMITAAGEGKWSKVFAFISSASMTTSIGLGGKSSSFSPINGNASFNLGFGYFPAVKLGDAAVEQLKLRKKEIKLEQARVVESTLGSLKQAKIQLDQSRKAEIGLQQVFQIQLEKYNMGLTDILHVLDSQNSVTLASTARVKSQMDLDGLRITLHRIMQTDQFSKIKGCKLQPERSGGFWGRIKDFFTSSSSQKSLDELCRPDSKE